MSTSPFHVYRRADSRAGRRRAQAASNKRPGWVEIAEDGILYFGVTLLPLLVVILLYQSGVIA